VLYVYTFGPEGGAPLLALHGLKGYGGRWRSFVTSQLPSHQTFAPDLRGHGNSPWAPPWSMQQHIKDVVKVLDAYGLEAVDVLGHSFGAAVGLYLSLAAPERVKRLMLLDPGLEMPGSLVAGLAAELPPSFDDPAAALTARVDHWPLAAESLAAAEIADHLSLDPDGRWRWRYSSRMLAELPSEIQGEVPIPPASVPTALLLARDSKRAYAAQWRGLSHVTVQDVDSGHLIHLETPATAGLLLREWLGLASFA
jgi:lipase